MMWLTLAALAAPVGVTGSTIAFVGARILPVSGEPIDNGVIIVIGGSITAVGQRDSVVVPPNATVFDVTGKVIIPGLVDTHSHIGAGGPGELNERSGPLQPSVTAIDVIDGTHPSLQIAQAGGLTTVNVMPGSGNLVGGQTAYLKLRDRVTVDELLFCERRSEICGGLKMANGTNPQAEGAYPRTRMGAASQVRALLLEAQMRKKAMDAALYPEKPRKAPEMPAPDLRLDPLVEALRGKRMVHFHTHRADDIATAISLSEQFGFQVVLHHVSEGWKVVDLLAAHRVPCSVILVDSPGGKEEAVEIRFETAGLLEAAGVQVAIHTDDPITDSRLFLRSGALAVRGGMSEAGALRALTLQGAIMLGLDRRVGSLEPGKDADFVVLSGDPFSVWTQVLQTWVEGDLVFDRADPMDLRYATGGFDVADRYPVMSPMMEQP